MGPMCNGEVPARAPSEHTPCSPGASRLARVRATRCGLFALLGCALAALALPALAAASAYHHKAQGAAPSAQPLAAGWRMPKPSLGAGPQAAGWVCPEGPCEAILAPEPSRVAAGWRQPGSDRALEGGGEFGGLAPKDLQSAYGIPSGTESTETIAVVDPYSYTTAESDLAAYRSRYGLPPCAKAGGCLRRVNESGEEGAYPAPNSAWSEEAALDLDMVSAACPECHILLVEPRNESEANLAEGANTAAKLGAGVISNSYATNETECLSNGCVALDKDYEHPGVLVTASAGDWGYDDLYFESIGREAFGTFFPASAPGVVSVGGTALYKDVNAARGWREEVWNEPKSSVAGSKGAGTSGGCTTMQPKPSWQTDTGCGHRTDNDIAAVAALRTPVSVRIQGAWANYGGTSVAAPLVAGIEAHASAYVRSLGPQALYEDSASLNDVTQGFDYYPGASPCAAHEYLCSAGLGYDGPTGLGTPDGVPLIAQPGAPEVTLDATSEITGVSALLGASVNPGGSNVSECRFEYGTTTAYGSSVTCDPAPGSGTGAVPVSGALSGLQAGTTYHFRIFAKNGGGPMYSPDGTFATRSAPVASIGTAGSVTIVSAQLAGTINPEGSSVSECDFEYWSTSTPVASVACSPPPGTGSEAVTVSGTPSQLLAATTYHFRLFARTSAGSAASSTATFTTLSGPLVSAAAASGVTVGSAELNGTVNPEGEAASECVFEYGTSTTYGSRVPCSPSPGAGSSAVAVSATLAGLRPARTYDFRLRVVDSAGTAGSANRTFTTPPAPTVSAGSASTVTSSSAQLHGTVNPKGASVSQCSFEYGTSTAYGSTVACRPLPSGGTSVVGVSATASPLLVNTSYDFRLSIVSSEGAFTSSNEPFRTARAPAHALIKPLR